MKFGNWKQTVDMALMEIPSEKIDTESVARQAYMLRAMSSALRKIKRNPRKRNVHPRITEVAAMMDYLPPKQKKTNKTQGLKIEKRAETKMEPEERVEVKLELDAMPPAKGKTFASRRRPLMTEMASQGPAPEQAGKKRRKADDVWAPVEAAMRGEAEAGPGEPKAEEV